MSFTGNVHPGPEDDEDDELAKRFKALFNKDPASTTPTAARSSSSWNPSELHEYIVDEEEVSPPSNAWTCGLTRHLAGHAD